MRRVSGRLFAHFVDPVRAFDARDLVLGVGGLMIAAQLAFRAWALYPSWFFLDDYNLLHDAMFGRLGLQYLMQPYNGHLMPGGRLLVWVVAESGILNWPFAASLTLAFQALASAAALWMLVTLFGRRWGVLAPLSVYLTSVMTVPAFIWWAAALNQVAIQLAFFLAVGAAVHYLRGRGTRWLLVAVGAVASGLLFDVKALLILPVLAFLVVAYWVPGTPAERLRIASRRYWPALLLSGVTGGVYLVYYLNNVPQPFVRSSLALTFHLANTMLGTAFVAGALGGPWHWSLQAPPTAMADPPDAAVHLAWVVAALVMLYGALRRRRTLRAWLLLAAYLIGLLALLVNSRAPAYGATLGLEYRYLTDAICVLTLCLGLVFLPLVGAVESSEPRADPLLRVELQSALLVVALVVVAGSGLFSSALYARYWHSDNASAAFMHNLRAALAAEGSVDLADTQVPENVQSHLTAPDNTTRHLAPLVSSLAHFPSATPRLTVVAEDGSLHRAAIQLGVPSQPGPRPGCGWRVADSGRSIPLTGQAFRWGWWVRIGYLATQDSPVVVSAGDSTVETSVNAGLHSLYVRVEGSFDSVRIDGLEPGAALCVDTVEVGQPTPGEGLE